jgi:hypothetical protein
VDVEFSFVPIVLPNSAKATPSRLQTNLELSLDYFNEVHFYLTLRAPFAFWEADFHTMKGRETLSRSHHDSNTTDYNQTD